MSEKEPRRQIDNAANQKEGAAEAKEKEPEAIAKKLLIRKRFKLFPNGDDKEGIDFKEVPAVFRVLAEKPDPKEGKTYVQLGDKNGNKIGWKEVTQEDSYEWNTRFVFRIKDSVYPL